MKFLNNFVLSLVILILISCSKNEKVSEQFIQAGVYLSLNEEEKSKKIYKEIIKSKNKFYSILALNKIIDNKLEQNKEEILNLFEIVENSKVDREQKNLVKLKKALYLIKISRESEGKNYLMKLFLIIQYGRKLRLNYQNFKITNIIIIKIIKKNA